MGYLDVRVVTDRPGEQVWSKDKLLCTIRSFSAASAPGDTLLFYYSGHGGQLPDYNGDEKDGLDECIYSTLLEPVTDDELRSILVEGCHPQAKLRCFMDCCHSGTNLDLPYGYSVKGGNVVVESCPTTRDAILVSACQDSEVDAETVDGGIHGSLTACVLHTLGERSARSRTQCTWSDFIDVVTTKMRIFSTVQVPQLSVSKRGGENGLVDV